MARQNGIIIAVGVLLVICACNGTSDGSRFGLLRAEYALECESPAPLVTVQCDAVPNSYIVSLREGVDGGQEAARLASEYGFTLTHVYMFGAGFSASMPEEVANSLRCEPTVEQVAPNCYIYPDVG